jgi:hypothetical protein
MEETMAAVRLINCFEVPAVNYVEWQSAEHLAAARDEQYIQLTRAVLTAGVTSSHALYEIIHEGSTSASGDSDR